MSIAQNLLEMIRQEMADHGATKLHTVHIRYGRLSNLVPEALEFAFKALTGDTELEGASLVLEEMPLVVKCCGCQQEFTPEEAVNLMYIPCPHCGEEFGHEVISGKELYLDRLEAE